jgi:hypothetical protein
VPDGYDEPLNVEDVDFEELVTAMLQVDPEQLPDDEDDDD